MPSTGTGNTLTTRLSGNSGGQPCSTADGGVDTLNGGAGVRHTTGGAGNDTFVFLSGRGERRPVTDFASGDLLKFQGYGTAAQGANVRANRRNALADQFGRWFDSRHNIAEQWICAAAIQFSLV